MVEHKNPKLTVDAVIMEGDSVVLIKRKCEPFKAAWALPGGYVDYGERVEDAVVREAREETGLMVKVRGLVGVYSSPDRDPRGHTVSIAFMCERVGGSMSASDDAAMVGKFKLEKPPKLAFDHERILNDARALLSALSK